MGVIEGCAEGEARQKAHAPSMFRLCFTAPPYPLPLWGRGSDRTQCSWINHPQRSALAFSIGVGGGAGGARGLPVRWPSRQPTNSAISVAVGMKPST